MNLWNIYHNSIPEFLQAAAATVPMQRLQHIGMNCGCEYTNFPTFSTCEPYSRFEHSLGVALIIWHFTSSKAQAMAGLLHDIATPAFAHVIDFLNGDYLLQESTESKTSELIRGSSQLKDQLEQYELTVEDVEDYHQYPIADNAAPMLSADRLEYTLGNAVNFRIITQKQAWEYYQDLHIGKNEHGQDEIMFQDEEKAYIFAAAALRCSKIYVSDADRYAMQILAEILYGALRSNVISEKDLYSTEEDVIHKLKESRYRTEWDTFCGYTEIEGCDKPMSQEKWRLIRSKKRFIDPYVDGKGRVSELFPQFNQDISAFKNMSLDYWILGRQVTKYKDS